MADESPDIQEIIAQLENLPLEVNRELASRAALRVWPLTLPPFVRDPQLDWAAPAVLTSFRCLLLTDLLRDVSISRDKVAAAGAAARAAARDAVGEAAGEATWTAAGAADRDYSASVVALAAAGDAARAAAGAAGDARDAARDAFNRDLVRAEKSPDDFKTRQPLWGIDVETSSPIPTPNWVLAPLIEADETLPEDSPWRCLLDWYNALLPTDPNVPPHFPFDLKKAQNLVDQDDAFWEGAPDEVVAKVAEILGGRAEAPPNKKPAKERSDAPIKGDHPATEDTLGRRPFAEALAVRMDQVHQQGKENGSDSGFAVHLHAPWGAGKSSILNMVEEKMRDGAGLSEPWTVVDFNAWEHEHRRPPWWPMLEALKAELQRPQHTFGFMRIGLIRCLVALCILAFGMFGVGVAAAHPQDIPAWIVLPLFGGVLASAITTAGSDVRRAFRVASHWFRWKTMSDLLPLLTASALIAGAVAIFFVPTGMPQTADASERLLSKNLGEWMKVIGATAVAFAAVQAFGRALLFGSADAAKKMEEMSRDPMRHFRKLFEQLVATSDRPICIFIDDLDRCSADYVVDLLEGIQTIFRHQNVVYLVAADRNWIRSSFRQRYDDFSSAVGSETEPIGYLFLEKVFQLSTPIPGMSAEKKKIFFDDILDHLDEKPEATEEASSIEVPSDDDGNGSHDSSGKTNLPEGARTLTSPQTEKNRGDAPEPMSEEAEKIRKHELAKYVDLLPHNPRFIKRFLNAYAMRQVIRKLEGVDVPEDVLVRWTLIEQRWPVFAEHVTRTPEWLDVATEAPQDSDRYPDEMKGFFGHQGVAAIIAADDAKERRRLTPADVVAITGGLSATLHQTDAEITEGTTA